MAGGSFLDSVMVRSAGNRSKEREGGGGGVGKGGEGGGVGEWEGEEKGGGRQKAVAQDASPPSPTTEHYINRSGRCFVCVCRKGKGQKYIMCLLLYSM
jgi:hypothetical protein